MKKILKIVCFVLLIYLSASVSFVSSITFAQELSTCAAVRQWEMENWPSVVYCKNPITVESDERYFVFVSKPNDYIDVILSPEDFTVDTIEALHKTEGGQDVASWDGSQITVVSDGSFIIRGSGTELNLEASDEMVRIYGLDECVDAISIAFVMNEEARFDIIRYIDAESSFLTVLGTGISLLNFAIQPNQIQASPDLIPRFQEDLPNLKNLLGNNANEVIFFSSTVGGVKKVFLHVFGNEEKFYTFYDHIRATYPEAVIETHTHISDGKNYYDVFISRNPETALNFKNIFIESLDEAEIGRAIAEATRNSIEEAIGIPLERHIAEAIGARSYHTRAGAELQGQIGSYLYTPSAGEHFKQTLSIEGNPPEKPTFTKVLYDKVINGEITELDPVQLLASFEHDSYDYEAKQFAQSIANFARKIDPSLLDDAARSSKNYILRRNKDKPSIDDLRIILDDAEANVGPIFDFLSQVSGSIDTLSLSYTFLDKTLNLDTEILDIYGLISCQDCPGKLTYNQGFNLLTNKKIEVAQLQSDVMVWDSDSPLIDVLKSQIDLIDQTDQYLFLKDNPEVRRYLYDVHSKTSQVVVEKALKGLKDVDILGTGLDNNGFSPTQQAIDDAQLAADDFIKDMDEIVPTVETDFVVKAGESLNVVDSDIPEISYNPLKTAVKRIFSPGAILSGFSFSFLTQFGGRLLTLFSESENPRLSYFAQLLGSGLQVAGNAFLVYWIVNTIWTAYVYVTIGAWVLLGTMIVSTVISFVVGYVIGLVTFFIIDMIFKMLFQPQPYCKIDSPWYSWAKLGLKNEIVKEGGVVEYIYYGVLFNPDVCFGIYLSYEDQYGHIYSIGHPQMCDSVDGRCFECYATVTSPEGGDTYPVYVRTDYFGTNTDFEYLTVCPTDRWVDESENKCVTCNTVTHTESSGTCEEGCGASHYCDEIIPGTGSCTVNCNYCNPDGTSGDGLCRTECGASLECDGFHPEGLYVGCSYGNPKLMDSCDSNCKVYDGRCFIFCDENMDFGCNVNFPGNWCDGDIKKSCSSTCDYSYQDCTNYGPSYICSDGECIATTSTTTSITSTTSTTSSTSTTTIFTTTSTTTTIPGECPGNINNDGIVDIYDAIILANAFGSSPGDPSWNPDADITGDDHIIDIYDAILLATDFGSECETFQTTTSTTTTIPECYRDIDCCQAYDGPCTTTGRCVSGHCICGGGGANCRIL